MVGTVVLLVGAGLAFVFAKDASIFDIFFSGNQKEERALDRMEGLYPESIGDFSLYARGSEKIRKERNWCDEIDETIHRDSGNIQIKGTLCYRITVGEYRNAENKTVFINIMQITKGEDTPGIDYLFGERAIVDKLGDYNIMRPENHEIGWFPADNSKIHVILTQEGVARKNSDGGESMLYQNKATGDNPVTQYFISKYPPTKNN